MFLEKKHIRTLLSKISKSDEKAFEELFHHYFPWLISRVMGIVRKKEVAEEIVEDVFFKLWQIRDGVNKIDNIETYLYVAAKNKSYNYLKSSGNYRLHQSIEESEISKTSSSPENIYLNQELKRQLDYAVAALPERCRHIFELVRIKGNSYKETAEILNITPKTVENQLAIAIKKLSESLEGYYKDSPKGKKSDSAPLPIALLLLTSSL